ncbi:MAG TPA: ThuA domain-containing protein, partial [Planctomycetota bacterium]|nr:ThuA domain-containing protein [Planctomycetota bacterium]
MARTAFIACASVLAALSGTALAEEPAAPPRKIVLIAGPITGHPKGTHEYEKSVILLKHLLDTSPGLKGLRVEAHFKGWPADPRALDDAATIVMVSDGSDQKETDHPLHVGDRLARLEDAARRGSGFVQLHWTTFHPSRFHDRITEIAGGYFDYETGTGNPRWHSRIETRKWPVSVLAPEHPISRGVHPFEIEEEFYYRLRFRENDPRLRPILAIDPASGGTMTERTVAWAIERAGGGRSFGFTGGHFFANWRSADFRRLVLNAIVWSAGVEVPQGGVQSEVEDPIRALILTGYNHPAHEWRSVTAALLGVLEQDPRAVVEVTEEPEDLAAPRLQTYGLLVLNYSNWDRPGLSAAAKEGLLEYLAGGGGLAVIHFANGAFNHTLPAKDSDWEEYRTRIVRRVWMHGDGGSGHDAFAPFRVVITSLLHPITRGLQPFDTEDELYFEQKGDLPIEPLATARSKVTGRDEPMAWAYEHGKARVFQTVLGHSDVSVRRAGALIRRGSVWAAGRSQLSFDPPPGLAEGLLFRDGSQWSPRKSREAEGKKPDRRQGNAAPRGENSSSEGSGSKTALADDSTARTPEARPAEVLPPNPGLDGGVGGHWGVKGDADWVDARIAAMNYGQFLSSSLETPSGTVAKGISIRLGERGEAAVCFDSGARSL